MATWKLYAVLLCALCASVFQISYAQKQTTKPLYNDPVYNGTADPVIIYNKQKKKCWMLYYWALVDFSKPFDRFDGYVVKQKGTIASPDIGATQQGTLNVRLPADYKNYDALVIFAKNPLGKELF